VPLLPFPDDPSASCELVALSFTLPYLEPYLIRTMRAASKQIHDPDLAADMKAFSGQEAQHHQNHSRLNAAVRSQLSQPTAAALQALEDALDADYRRYTAEKSLAFNLAYAEGFEAMTFALARSMISSPDAERMVPEWQGIAVWHLAEEIEHRTVTYDAYEAIVGSYPYRVAAGTRSQIHFLGYLLRMATVLERELADPGTSFMRVARSSVRRQWKLGTIPGGLRALSPRYNPRRVELSQRVRDIGAVVGIDFG
jgi:predicted metal-dependent hydrolase